MNATTSVLIRPTRPWIPTKKPLRGHYDCAVIGGGFAGMGVAARLQAQGLTTVVVESHSQPGGCAGYFTRRGFSFDVGATTLVDAGPGGVIGNMLDECGMGPLDAERLSAYSFWLPDRCATLWHDRALWRRERSRVIGKSNGHYKLWALLDELSEVFWPASRRGLRLPLTSVGEVVRAVRAVGLRALPLARHLNRTVEDALRSCGIGTENADDIALRGLLGALVEDTVHSTLDRAPLINAALGISIRDAGVYRHHGGMKGFWEAWAGNYVAQGGEMLLNTKVEAVRGRAGNFVLDTTCGPVQAAQVVSAIPAEVTARIGPPEVSRRLAGHVKSNAKARGGAVVVFLGVPEDEVACQEHTHHQLVHDCRGPLTEGNNMFISVSAEHDRMSAPIGHRAVMISTHTDLEGWNDLDPDTHEATKGFIAQRLIQRARRVYPRLGMDAVVMETGTPRAFEKFTRRPQGAVGGYRLSPANANQQAIPQDIGVPGFWLAGDTTWPGLGTVACAISSGIAAGLVRELAPTWQRRAVVAMRGARRQLQRA